MDDGIQDLDELARFLDLNQDSPENMIIETSTPHKATLKMVRTPFVHILPSPFLSYTKPRYSTLE